MKERPILFSGEMVRAILDGRKTQTRRVIKPQPSFAKYPDVDHIHRLNDVGFWYQVTKTGKCLIREHGDKWNCPYGQPGDRLWVRETHSWITLAANEYNGLNPDHRWHDDNYPVTMLYRADGIDIPARWRPSIHMPRWASRIDLEIIGVRVEQVQDISHEDAQTEGLPTKWAFIDLWDSLNAKRGYSWYSNPWVWVIEFEVMR